MKLKQGIEIKLKKSKIPFTIFRLSGFYQGLIEQYAIPILDDLPIWITNENTSVSYMDTQDIAKFYLRALQLPETKNKTFSLGGPKGWVSSEIINICEIFVGRSPKIQRIPILLLKLTSQLLGFFEWGQNISDRLTFAEILNIENNFSKSTSELYKTFKVNSEEILPLDDYLLDYYIQLLKQLRDINFEDVQKQKNLII